MVNEQTILDVERLRDDINEFRKELRKRYKTANRQVTADSLCDRAAQLAEKWLVGVAADAEATNAMGLGTFADLSVHFQRILSFTEHATTRLRYDVELREISKNFTVRVLLPLKQSRGHDTAVPAKVQPNSINSAFLGQSFAGSDKRVNDCVLQILEALGIKVVTGEKPKADSISEKVKRLIDEQHVFVGVFTRRDKIARKSEWTTSSWVIDEKAYAVGRRKPLILLKETGVGSIGGIQGDYEFIEFSRDALESLVLRIVQLFDCANKGLRR